MKQKKKGFKVFLLLLLGYMLVFVFYTKILLRFKEMPMQFSVLLQLTAYLVLGGVGACLFWHDLKAGLALWQEHTGKNLCLLLGAFVLDMVLSNLAAVPGSLLYPNYEAMNEHSVAELVGKFPALLLIVSLGIMGPVTEEVIFRLAPIGLTGKKHQKIMMVFAAAALFMLVHMHAFTWEELLSNLPHFATGLVYGFALVISRNATLPVLLHMMNNLPAMLLATLSGMV